MLGDVFRKAFPGCKNPDEWVDALNVVMLRYGITGRLRIAAFLAQCGHESEGFTAVRENLNYSATALMATWPKRFPAGVATEYARQPERIANRAYANRMGNGPEESGDGWKYRGRGPIQATGKDHYLDFARRKGCTLDEAVALLESPQGGVEFACMFWKDNGLNALADKGDIVGITKRINGGVNGLEDRKARYSRLLGLMEG